MDDFLETGGPRFPWQGVAAILGFALVLGGVAAAFSQIERGASGEASSGDICGAPESHPASMAMLVDGTDPPTPEQVTAIHDELGAAANNAQAGTFVTVWWMRGQEAYRIERRYAGCALRSAADTSPYLEYPGNVEEKRQKVYLGPIDAAIDGMSAAPTGGRSPLVEDLTALTWQTEFRPSLSTHRTLVWVTDLFQFTPSANLYRATSVTEAVRELGRAGGPDLSGVDLKVVVIRRPEMARQQMEIAIPAMCAYLTGRGAQSVTIDGSSCGASPGRPS